MSLEEFLPKKPLDKVPPAGPRRFRVRGVKGKPLKPRTEVPGLNPQEKARGLLRLKTFLISRRAMVSRTPKSDDEVAKMNELLDFLRRLEDTK